MGYLLWDIYVFTATGTANKPVIVYEFPFYVVFTIFATLFAAVLAQILSHLFTLRRDNKKEFMQKYQDLYVNIIAPISNYMYIKTNPRKYHDVHESVVESDLLDITLIKFEENIKYASPVLLKVNERLYGQGFYEDGWGSTEEIDKHAIVYFLLEDIIRTSRWSGVFSKRDKKTLKKLKYYYGICAMGLNFFSMEDVELILQMENFSGVKKKIKYKDFGKELLFLDRSKMKKHLLKHLYRVEKNSRDMYSELINELQSYGK